MCPGMGNASVVGDLLSTQQEVGPAAEIAGILEICRAMRGSLGYGALQGLGQGPGLGLGLRATQRSTLCLHYSQLPEYRPLEGRRIQ